MLKHDPTLMVTVEVLEARGARFRTAQGGRVEIRHEGDMHLIEGLKGRKRELYAFIRDRQKIREQHNPTSRVALAIDQGAVAAEYLEAGLSFTLEGITFLPGMF